ncbi:MAG TPA: hypothetical protein VJX29_05980 [Candidatus Acidoferrales bacterium]|nr:hypothetical protein [Candidatus Acidoferrales bacterium]
MDLAEEFQHHAELHGASSVEGISRTDFQLVFAVESAEYHGHFRAALCDPLLDLSARGFERLVSCGGSAREKGNEGHGRESAGKLKVAREPAAA